jgi:hypothetical protein
LETSSLRRNLRRSNLRASVNATVTLRLHCQWILGVSDEAIASYDDVLDPDKIFFEEVLEV